MTEGGYYSTKHPHEPQIPPALDAEGRCLVCLGLHLIEVLHHGNANGETPEIRAWCGLVLAEIGLA